MILLLLDHRWLINNRLGLNQQNNATVDDKFMGPKTGPDGPTKEGPARKQSGYVSRAGGARSTASQSLRFLLSMAGPHVLLSSVVKDRHV